ncbi:sugar-binding domain-containing protein [Streptomyces sp. NPDC001795]|uniref:sugar-binding transcriptional regulator n=1 Tax=unclassified Streptomyces TaxID=2593676 RepID=UPI003331F1DC
MGPTDMLRAAAQGSMGPTEMLRATTIARQYFLEGRSKVDIAQEFGISRYKVARILDECLEKGIVRIEIATPTAVDGELSEQLRRTFDLQHVLVIKTTASDAATLRRELGTAAAALLTEVVTEDDILGVSWGRTLHAMARSLTSLAPCSIVQMTGVTGTVSANSADLVRRLAAVSNGPVYPIYAPLVVSDAATAQAILTQPGIAAAVSRFGSITKAAVAIGSWDAEGSQLYPLLEPKTLAALSSEDVAAEACSIPLAEDGTPVDPDLARRTIGIGFDALRRIPEVIAVAGGESKARAIHTVLNSGLAHSLVVDDRAARRVLALHT